jgi:hypothetical protein
MKIGAEIALFNMLINQLKDQTDCKDRLYAALAPQNVTRPYAVLVTHSGVAQRYGQKTDFEFLVCIYVYSESIERLSNIGQKIYALLNNARLSYEGWRTTHCYINARRILTEPIPSAQVLHCEEIEVIIRISG